MPFPDPYIDYLFSAFVTLYKSKNESGAIPISEIKAYYEMFEEDIIDSKSEFMYFMQEMNDVMIMDYQDRLEQAQG